MYICVTRIRQPSRAHTNCFFFCPFTTFYIAIPACFFLCQPILEQLFGLDQKHDSKPFKPKPSWYLMMDTVVMRSNNIWLTQIHLILSFKMCIRVSDYVIRTDVYLVHLIKTYGKQYSRFLFSMYNAIFIIMSTNMCRYGVTVCRSLYLTWQISLSVPIDQRKVSDNFIE